MSGREGGCSGYSVHPCPRGWYPKAIGGTNRGGRRERERGWREGDIKAALL